MNDFIARSGWTREMDIQLRELVETYGNKWIFIAELMNRHKMLGCERNRTLRGRNRTNRWE